MNDTIGIDISKDPRRSLAVRRTEPRTPTVCPPVVEHGREFQARAAEELKSLMRDSAGNRPVSLL